MVFYPPPASAIAIVMRSKGYKVFENADGYDLNLFGIRTNDASANTFNDWVGVMYRAGGPWNLFAFPATTDPGLYWRENPMNVKGAAILKPGQYRGSHRIGQHKGYVALQQKGPVTVYRDADRNAKLDVDESTTDEGMFGINIHRASIQRASMQVGRWSAGCQVLQDALHFDFLMAMARNSASIYGNSFTYTLLAQSDFQ